MQVFNITSNTITRQNFGISLNKSEKSNLPEIPADSFTFRGQSVFPLKEITHKSAEKLFNTDYVPQIPSKKGYYRTFVIDKNTGKYVDLYVKENSIINPDYRTQEYDFYRLEKGKLKHVISSGDMETYDKSLKGIGQRGQQLTVEYMRKYGYKECEALSLFGAYDFNYGNGFRVIDEFANTKETVKSGFIELWKQLLKIDEKSINKMLVYKSANDFSEINLTASMANFAQYANKKGLTMLDELIIPMKLTTSALKEWFSLSKLKPILK